MHLVPFIEKGDFGRNSQNFHPVHLSSTLRGFPWNFVTAVGFRKTKYCSYKRVKKVRRYVHLFRYNTTSTGETEARTESVKQYRDHFRQPQQENYIRW